jgi:hypothetical protein
MTPNPPEDKSNIGSESLTDQFIADTYYGELHTKNVPITGERFPHVFDGYGNQSSLQMGVSSIKVNGLEFPQAFIDMLYPVGAIYLSSDDINPSNHIPYTSWVRVSQGRFLAGVGSAIDADSKSQSIGSGDDNVGVYNQTMTVDEMPSHRHDPDTEKSDFKYFVTWYKEGRVARQEAGGDDNSSYSFPDKPFYTGGMTQEGGGEAHNNLPPTFGIYVWKRIN